MLNKPATVYRSVCVKKERTGGQTERAKETERRWRESGGRGGREERGEAHFLGGAEPDAVLQVIPLFQVEGTEQGRVGATGGQGVGHAQGVVGEV